MTHCPHDATDGWLENPAVSKVQWQATHVNKFKYLYMQVLFVWPLKATRKKTCLTKCDSL